MHNTVSSTKFRTSALSPGVSYSWAAVLYFVLVAVTTYTDLGGK